MICTCIPPHTYFLDCALSLETSVRCPPRGHSPTGKGSSLLALPQAPEVGWVPHPWAAQALGHPCLPHPQRSRSACGSVAAAWRLFPAAAWDTVQEAAPLHLLEAAALSSPGKWPSAQQGPEHTADQPRTGLTVGCVETCPARGRPGNDRGSCRD